MQTMKEQLIKAFSNMSTENLKELKQDYEIRINEANMTGIEPDEVLLEAIHHIDEELKRRELVAKDNVDVVRFVPVNKRENVSRSDEWTSEEDEKLLSIVLKHIRNGSTQIEGFKEASKQLGRTSGACGFRWNAVLRAKYKEEIDLAKYERRKQERKESYKVNLVKDDNNVTLEKVLLGLNRIEEQLDNIMKTQKFLQERMIKLETFVQEAKLAHDIQLRAFYYNDKDDTTHVVIAHNRREVVEFLREYVPEAHFDQSAVEYLRDYGGTLEDYISATIHEWSYDNVYKSGEWKDNPKKIREVITELVDKGMEFPYYLK